MSYTETFRITALYGVLCGNILYKTLIFGLRKTFNLYGRLRCRISRTFANYTTKPII